VKPQRKQKKVNEKKSGPLLLSSCWKRKESKHPKKKQKLKPLKKNKNYNKNKTKTNKKYIKLLTTKQKMHKYFSLLLLFFLNMFLLCYIKKRKESV